jgi:hypothetical protein
MGRAYPGLAVASYHTDTLLDVIAASILYTLPDDTDWDAMRTLQRERSRLYVGMPGLRSKAFVVDPASRRYGGLYVWQSRGALDDFLQGDIVAGLVARFGRPEVRVFEVPVLIEESVVTAV